MRAIITIVESMVPADWDLGGAWITDHGEIELCDHEAGKHHSDIALEYFGDDVDTNDEGEHDEYSSESAQSIAYDQGWIRISIRGSASLAVEWQIPPSIEAKRALIGFLKSQHIVFQNYALDAIGKFSNFDDLKSLLRALHTA